MSGTDELFPDASEHPAVEFPTAPPSGARRGLGVAAFVLGLIALFGDLLGIVVAVVTLASAVTQVGQNLNNVDGSLGAFIGVIILEFAVFIGGIVFGLMALILGVLAAVRGRGRLLGALGAVLGLIVLVAHLVLAIAISGSGGIPGVTT